MAASCGAEHRHLPTDAIVAVLWISKLNHYGRFVDPSNIAEGLQGTSSADKVRFLDSARASCGEVLTQVVVGCGAGFIAEKFANVWIAETKEIFAMTEGLIRAIQTRSVKEQAAEYSLN